MMARLDKTGRKRNQESVYWDEPNKGGLDAIEKKYATQSRNAFINAAMRFYLAYGAWRGRGPLTVHVGERPEVGGRARSSA